MISVTPWLDRQALATCTQSSPAGGCVQPREGHGSLRAEETPWRTPAGLCALGGLSSTVPEEIEQAMHIGTEIQALSFLPHFRGAYTEAQEVKSPVMKIVI